MILLTLTRLEILLASHRAALQNKPMVNFIRNPSLLLATVLATGISLPTLASAANLFVDPSLESPITFDGPPFVGTWEGFNGGGATAANSTLSARTGTQSLRLAITNTDNTFSGAFQDVAGLTAGTPATVSGWLTAPSTPFDVGIEIRVEWRNSVTGMEISRTPNLTPTPTSTYVAFTQSSIVPAGADSARVVFAIQSFGPEPTNSGVAYFDDLSFEAVPEPTASLLTGAAALGLLARRRRQ